MRLVVLLCFGMAVALGARAQGPEPGTIALPGEAAPPDPMMDAHVAFHASAGEIVEDRARSIRLDAARRAAPFDLHWGLGDAP